MDGEIGGERLKREGKEKKEKCGDVEMKRRKKSE
jgi:hypothetical protein